MLALVNLSHQQPAVQALVRVCGGLPLLQAQLASPVYETRRAASFCLGNLVKGNAANGRELVSGGGVEALLRCVNDDDDDELAKTAYSTLSQLGEPCLLQLLALVDEAVRVWSESRGGGGGGGGAPPPAITASPPAADAQSADARLVGLAAPATARRDAVGDARAALFGRLGLAVAETGRPCRPSAVARTPRRRLGRTVARATWGASHAPHTPTRDEAIDGRPGRLREIATTKPPSYRPAFSLGITILCQDRLGNMKFGTELR